MKEKIPHTAHIGEMLKGLSCICKKLWAENHPAAVNIQAVIEEFREEVEAVERMVPEYEKYSEMKLASIEQKIKEEYLEKFSQAETKLAENTGRIHELESSLKSEKENSAGLNGVIEAKTFEIKDLKARISVAESELRAKYVEKMHELYDQVSQKESEMAVYWENKYKLLEEKKRSLENDYVDKIRQIEEQSRSMEKEIASKKDELFRVFDKAGRELE